MEAGVKGLISAIIIKQLSRNMFGRVTGLKRIRLIG